jgi:myosin I
MFGLQGPESYAYTSLSNCLEVSGIDDIQDFSETIVCICCFLLDRSYNIDIVTEGDADCGSE